MNPSRLKSVAENFLLLAVFSLVFFVALPGTDFASTTPDSVIWYSQNVTPIPGETSTVQTFNDQPQDEGCFGDLGDYGTCNSSTNGSPNPDGSVTHCQETNTGGAESCGTTFPDGSTVVINNSGAFTPDTYGLTDQTGNQLSPATGQALSSGQTPVTYNPNAGSTETPNVVQSLTNVGNAVASAAAPVLQCTGASLWNCILGGLAYFLFQVSATILGFIGLIFNWVVTVTIFQYATYFANSAGFLLSWGILRDVGNIMLLFGFIFMGIATILDIQSFGAKKALPALLIFAVLLNFSLFAAEAVVDVANALTSTFYTQAGSSNESANCNTVVSSASSAVTNNCATAVGISGEILQASGLASIFNPSNSNVFKPSSAPLVLFLLAIFAAIAAVVLLAGAIMLFLRAILLSFLLIASPLGFAAMALPPLKKMAMSWWNMLLSQAFFAPVFLLLILVSMKILSSITTSNGASFANAVSAPGSSNVGVFFIFCLLIGFMIASLMAAKSLNKIGAEYATKTAGSAIFGTAGFVGRRTAGRGFNYAADSLRKTSFARTGAGRMAIGALDAGAKGSYDLRGTKTFGGLTKGAKIDLGKAGGSGGYQKTLHDATDERVKYGKSLRNTTKEKEKLGELDELIKDENKKYQLDLAKEQDPTKKVELQLKHVEELKKLEKKKRDLSPQQKYANRLQREAGSPVGMIMGLATAGPAADHHAAEEILKELKKSKTEKAIEGLKASIDKGNKSHDEHIDAVKDEMANENEKGGANGGGAAPAGGGDHGGGH